MPRSLSPYAGVHYRHGRSIFDADECWSGVLFPLTKVVGFRFTRGRRSLTSDGTKKRCNCRVKAILSLRFNLGREMDLSGAFPSFPRPHISIGNHSDEF
jgi:hypothetical protein